MKQTLAFLLGVLCGVSGLTHVLYWCFIAAVLVAYYFHVVPLLHCR